MSAFVKSLSVNSKSRVIFMPHKQTKEIMNKIKIKSPMTTSITSMKVLKTRQTLKSL